MIFYAFGIATIVSLVHIAQVNRAHVGEDVHPNQRWVHVRKIERWLDSKTWKDPLETYHLTNSAGS
jgi:hypothetical protein